jgi:hypothetical protein
MTSTDLQRHLDIIQTLQTQLAQYEKQATASAQSYRSEAGPASPRSYEGQNSHGHGHGRGGGGGGGARRFDIRGRAKGSFGPAASRTSNPPRTTTPDNHGSRTITPSHAQPPTGPKPSESERPPVDIPTGPRRTEKVETDRTLTDRMGDRGSKRRR